MKKLFQGLLYRFVSLRRDERGYAVMATLAIFLFLFVLCAAVYAVGETIHERIKIQNACDAAAYSAAAVQADGLSRMACVNRAMSWTYVQMSNRQMDYITYRWLWLTLERFKEDRDNAKGFADHMNIVCDKELGFFAILEVAVSGILDLWLKYPCDTGDHRPGNSDGHPWWAGQEGTQIDLISLNKFPAIMGTTTYANLFSVRSFLGNVFDGDGAEGSAKLLGTLIDYDKINISQMNKALARINYEMTRSMRETAENILKASLADNRLSSQESLADYYVSISIPYAGNPYSSSQGADTNGNVKSYFSPLRNTEVDERLFLQMHATNSVEKSLAALFPKLLIGSTSTAFGIDQWFVRGKGTYSGGGAIVDDAGLMMSRFDDPKDLWAEKPASPSYDKKKNTSGWLAENSTRLTGTVRSEGELGLQRVYKDTELNESGAGLELADSVTVKEVFRGNHLMNAAAFLKSGVQAFKHFIGGGGSLESEDDDKDDDPDIKDDDILDDSKSPAEVIAKLEQQKEELKRQRDEIDRSRTETGAKINELKRQLEVLGPDDDQEQLQKELDYQKIVFEGQNNKYNELSEQIAKIDESIREVEENESDAVSTTGSQDGAEAGHDNDGYEDSKPGFGLGEILSGLLDDLISFLGDRMLDIQPSCTHVHANEGFTPSMCEKAAERTGLVSQYRWASCKWYCLTTAKAWLYSIIWNHRRIWCDREKHTFKKILRHKFKARGIGHFGFPKWFCARKPDQPLETQWGLLDKVLHRFPPFPVKNPYSEPGKTYYRLTTTHGYMETPFDILGFIEPFRPLFKAEDGSSNGFHRDDYESCAQFMDGSFNFWKGRDSYAGIIRGHARIYGDDKEIFDNRYVGAKCMPWVLNEKFFAGDGTIVIGAAKKFYNPFAQLIGFLGNEKAIADYDKSVLSAFKIPKNNYMWTMSAARAGVRRRRRNGPFDHERMYQVTYDSAPDAENLRYHDDVHVMLSGDESVPTRAWNVKSPVPVWDGCVCRIENKSRFTALWNLCESDWDATLLPLRYSRVRAEPRIKPSDDDLEAMGAGTNWVWSVMPTSGQLSLDHYSNPFIGSWWKRATDEYFNPLDIEWQQSMQFLPKANKLPGESSEAAAWRYWNMMQQNRIL